MLAPGERLVAVLDTCVLAPMPLCDTLLRLAEEPALYTPKWSADILRELRSTLQRIGYSPAQADRRIAAMTSAFEDARVDGYEPLIEAMGNHPKDRHVLAVAVRCEAQIIITFDVKDFGPGSVKPHGLDVLTPDEFLVDQLRFGAIDILEKLEAQATARGVARDELFGRLERSVPVAVQILRRA